MKSIIVHLSLLLFPLFFTSCAHYTQVEEVVPKLSIINIIDQNGLTETISTPDRIEQYENVDFLQCHPYKKVMRIYSRNGCGDVVALITSYHPNGQPWQYLEVVNGRAYGPYKEWHSNGVLKIEASIIGGEPDLNSASQKTWLFDGICKVWDDQGRCMAELPYSKGLLDGDSLYYHACGSLWKKAPCRQGKREGPQQVFLESGDLLSETYFVNDQLNGPAIRFWKNGEIASDETFCNGKLETGRYWDVSGFLITEVDGGYGKRVLFGKNTVSMIISYQNGIPDGKTEIYGSDGKLSSYYYQKDDVKHGEEVQLYPGTLNPKLLLTWYEGKIQGLTKSWYKNGQLENQREMSENTKNGLLTAWYLDGCLMMIEEYDHNKLIRGEYYRKGEKYPITEVIRGNGTVTIFDSEGTFLRRIAYVNGQPES